MAKGLIQDVTWRSTTLVVFENILIISAIGAGAYIRLGDDTWDLIRLDHGLLKALLISFVCQLCLYYGDLYDNPRLTIDHRELLVRIFQAFGATSLILSALYYWFPDLILGRGVFATSAVLVVVSLIGWRLGFGWMMAALPTSLGLLISAGVLVACLVFDVIQTYAVFPIKKP